MNSISQFCSICHKEIKVEVSISNCLFYEYWFDIKRHYHYKFRHKKQFFTSKGIIKRWFGFIILLLITGLFAPLYLITYPFKALHEYLF